MIIGIFDSSFTTFMCWFSFLQKVALENERGLLDNPLQISWLEGIAPAADANSESVSETSTSAMEGTPVESKVRLS